MLEKLKWGRSPKETQGVHRRAGATGSMEIDACSCFNYRHIALLIKFFIITSFLGPVNSMLYAESSLEKVANLYRLKGPSASTISFRTSSQSKETEGTCEGRATVDLIVEFKNPTKFEEWVDHKNYVKSGPCYVKAYPVDSGFEFRISYAATKSDKLQILPYEMGNQMVVDHWIEKNYTNKKPQNNIAPKNTSEFKAVYNPLLDLKNKIVQLYQDQQSWNNILGQSGQALSFDTPELDRFRTAINSQNIEYQKLAPEKRPLVVPLLSLPLLDAKLEFAERELEIPLFEKNDLPKDQVTKSNPRDIAIALEGLNYLRLQFNEKKWIKAQESLKILEKGSSAKLIPKDLAKWWALKGHILFQAGKEIKEDAFILMALDVWRDGLRRVAGKGNTEQLYADYMISESLRILFDRSLYYASAGILAWSERYRWSSEIEERLSYLRGEAYFRMGMMEDSRDSFEKFIELRKNLPLNSANDRRLLPVSFFRVGDSYLRQNDYQKAIQYYTRAFTQMSSQEKLSFEGAWLPAEIRYYPQVLYHRAEAYIRTGKIANALGDLRSFVNYASDHPNLGIIMYRLADLLELSGAPKEKIDGAWKECIFRTANDVGGKLCRARQAHRYFLTANKDSWPRLVAEMEDVLKANNLNVFEENFTEDLKIYIRLLLADGFLKREEPFQSYSQTMLTRGVQSSEDLRAWVSEYRVSAVAGYMRVKLNEKKFKEVLTFYQEAQKPPGLKINRPEVIWNIVKAYESLGAWKSADEFVKMGIKSNNNQRPHESRPYLPTAEEWKVLQILIQLSLLPNQMELESEIKKNIEELKDKNSIGYWKIGITFGKESKNEILELDSYEQLLKLQNLNWVEFSRYFYLLKNNKNFDQYKRKIELVVSTWLSNSNQKNDSGPPANLMFELFEAREKANESQKAENILNHLLQIQELNGGIVKEQIHYRKGLLLKNMGRKNDARQSFENAKTLAPESLWGKLSNTELQSLDI